MSTIKVFKKGEFLYKEGEKAASVYLIQSGSVNLFLTRHKNSIDLCTLGSAQIAGEHGVSGATTHPHSAVALSETKVIELTVDQVKGQFDTGTQLMKFLTKSLTDKLKLVMKEFQSARLERDNTPCPPDQTAKIFGTVYHVARTKGEASTDGTTKVNWPLMKQYAQRVFVESPKRLENAVNIFVKLGIAKYETVKNEDDPTQPDEVGFVHFSDLALVEQFFEFYQYYHFKGGKSELLKTDERVMQMVQQLVELGRAETPDRRGAVRLDYSKVVERFKDQLGLQLNADHFTLIENKGLFTKRHSTDKGVYLDFEFAEFERSSKIWRVLREVERWNDKGSVDPNEPISEPRKVLKSGTSCPKCDHPFDGAPKFCAECGHRFANAA